ncbi:opsin, blue-sensitive-like [Amphiura filiformis]|uniref:opsin, blue-sensitive-like n=1 Tax=Amphiura filiformis TaxID=82378 RepID=UPI003B20D903
MDCLNQTKCLSDFPTTLPSTTDIIVYQTYAERQLVASMLAIIAIIAFFGNGLVVVSVILSKKLRTITNVFVVNLSVADLFTALNLPWLVIGVLSPEGWPLPDKLCVFGAFMMICCLGCSATTLACIALNRLVLITRPKTTFQWLYTQKKVSAMLLFTWGIPASIAIVPLVSPIGELGFDTRYYTCSWKTSDPNTGIYSILVSVAFYPIQLTIIILSYVLIVRHIRKHTKSIIPDEAPSVSGGIQTTRESGVQKRIRRRQVDVTKNLFYVVCAYLICLTPYCVILVVPGGHEVVMYVAIILMFNSCINPFIYATKHPDFKKVFRCILF